ncbi:MAG: aminodeoxychorismate synthase component I [Thermodesulfobacteriota bacterium]
MKPEPMELTEVIRGIHVEPLELTQPLPEIAGHFAAEPGTVLLLSGGDLDCARYHFLAVDPWLQLRGSGRDMTLVTGNRRTEFAADPFETLDFLLSACRLPSPDLALPVGAGLFGYLSYDLKDRLENLPRTSMDAAGLPQICLYAPGILVVQDKLADRSWLCLPKFEGRNEASVQRQIAAFREKICRPLPPDGGFSGNPDGFRSDFTREEYEAAVQTIREYIAAGDVYQVNMSQRFEMTFHGDGYHLFKSLYRRNPAPFFAYIQAGDHQIVSTSPERFLKQRGRAIETRPIKGTRPRGTTAEEDAASGEQLRNNPKDDAELSMIVDLLRNDLGRVCRAGSVQVTQHKRLEAYQNVFHLVSVVEGRLEEDKTAVDLLRATFPGGSITGCPKIRAMEIIDELEPVRRHIYTGAIGYFGFHDTMDLSIAIRTAVIHEGRIVFSVGGGIVFDSVPADEYAETLHKGKTLMEAFAGEGTPSAEPSPVVWINGRCRNPDQAGIPITDLGVQYGFGFFETIRVHHGTPLHLADHLRRFNRTWGRLFPSSPPDLTWDDIIRETVRRNGLEDRVSAVKIIATRGTRLRPPVDHTLAVLARPYVHRLEATQKNGLDLATYPEPRRTPLADYKTLNYLYYHLAGEWARENGADEALILNPDGTVSETNSASLVVIRDRDLIRPESPAVLPGVMAEQVCGLLSKEGFSVQTRPVHPRELTTADMVLMTNALIGAVPILHLDGFALKPPSDLWRRINAQVLAPPPMDEYPAG